MWLAKQSVLSTCRSIRLSRRLLSSNVGSELPKLTEVGRMTDQLKTRYKIGQTFVHRVFAYRGVVVASFECKEYGRKDDSPNYYEIVPYYQVLVHRGDWEAVRFPIDITNYLSEGPNHEGKVLSTIQGMDCLPHRDILPFSVLPAANSGVVAEHFKDPIEHELFKRLFSLADPKRPEVGYDAAHDLARHRLWLAPQATHIETTENICVINLYRSGDSRQLITTYYLGQNAVGAQSKHCWRYVVRIESLDERNILLRERHIKVFSLNNLMQTSGNGAVGELPRLTHSHPAYQFSSTVDLAQKRGGHMWGKLRMEREDGTQFDVNLPTVLLECASDRTSASAEL